MYQGWGFAASTDGTVYFNGVATYESTDPNGYFIDIFEAVPVLPTGTYDVFAVFNGAIYTVAATTFAVSPLNEIWDGTFFEALSGDYVALSSSEVIVALSGLAPFQSVDAVDSGLLSLGYGTGSVAALCGAGIIGCGPILGNFDGVEFQADAAGAAIFWYYTAYDPTLPTGTSETVTGVASPSGAPLPGATATYYTVGSPTVPLLSSYAPGPRNTVSLTIGNLVPDGATMANGAVGYAGPFGIEIGREPVTFSTGKLYFRSSATGTATVSFANPQTSGGFATFDLYGDVSTVTGAPTGSSWWLFDSPVFVTSLASSGTNNIGTVDALSVSLGGSGTSGSPWMFYPDPSCQVSDQLNYYPTDYIGLSVYGATFAFWGLPASTTVTATWGTSGGMASATFTTDANGAAVYTVCPPDTASNVPAPIVYSLVFSSGAMVFSGATTYYWDLVTQASYLPAPFALNGGSPVTDYTYWTGGAAFVGTSVTVYLNSFLPTSPVFLVATPTDVAPVYTGSCDYVGPCMGLVANNATDSHGDTSLTFNVPATLAGAPVMTGSYYLWVVQEQFNDGVGPFVASGPLTLEVVQQVFAFPGQLIQWTWTPDSPRDLPLNSLAFTVTVLLNGTPYVTEQGMENPSETSIIGSFTMPNAAVGSWWWLTLNWTQTGTGYTNYAYYNEPASEAVWLQLVEGNGALLTGVSPGQIAQITTAINQTLTVPIAELNAAVVSINNAVVEITTQFGMMTTTLNAINATVSSSASGIANIENGIVTITTTLGTVTAALSALGATVSEIGNTVIVLNTSLGQVQTTLTAINAQLVGITNGVATLTTDVGQIQTSLASIGAQLTSVAGTVAEISSTLGTFSAPLSALDATVVSSAPTTVVGALVQVLTDLGALNGTVIAISGNIATIQTQLGTLQTSVNAIPTSTPSQGSVNMLTYLIYALIALAVIIIILIIVGMAMMGRQQPPAAPLKPYKNVEEGGVAVPEGKGSTSPGGPSSPGDKNP